MRLAGRAGRAIHHDEQAGHLLCARDELYGRGDGQLPRATLRHWTPLVHAAVHAATGKAALAAATTTAAATATSERYGLACVGAWRTHLMPCSLTECRASGVWRMRTLDISVTW